MTALSCLGVTINSFHQTVKQFIYFFLLREGGGGEGGKYLELLLLFLTA